MRKFKQIKKRAMAFALCAVMTLTSNVMVFAEGEVVPAIEESAAPIIEEVVSPVVEETEIVSEESSVIVEESDEAAAVAAVEEAVVTTEESSAVVEESSVIVEDSSVVIEESDAVAEEGTEATEKSVVTTAETLAATEVKTVETTGAAVGAVDGSVVTTEDTIEIVIQVLEYEDKDVKIHVEEATPEAIPDGTSLKVTPITAADKEYANVEQQLNEKAEGEEYEIAGFLAYDITFVDKDGNKVEPNGGVKVTMEYKEAILPEVVKEAETAAMDVTVMHFEEDVDGEVQEVVDMVAEVNIEAEVKTTENAEVEKAEFVTDSFSVFVVTWKHTRDNIEYSVTLKARYGYLDENGAFVEFDDINPPLDDWPFSTDKNDEIINLKDYANLEVGDYTYKGAYVAAGDVAYNDNIPATQLQMHNSNGGAVRLRYSNGGNYSNLINDVASNSICSIYYVYVTPPKPITTVDSKAEHINISVSDYSMWSENDKSWDHKVQYNINANHKLQFATTGNTSTTQNYNAYTGGTTPRQGFLEKNLISGYPVLKGESLGYLFNNGYDANHLFKKVDGYYVYDSAVNFASFDIATGNFKVYAEANKGFFPFNKITEDIKIESASKTTVENHHSGMHVDFTFMQPKNGKTAEKDMIFEFSGDDDVWVFIDDILVLDLGGIHQKTGGTINFATGEVTYTDAPNTTIYNMYVAALIEKMDLSEKQAKEEAKKYFVEYETGKYRFKDYSQHELNFFYLERGAHDSNCKIKFNLVSIPENSIFVEKKITESNMADFADAEFQFVIEKKDVQEDGTYPTESTILANTSYKLYEVDYAGKRTLIGERKTNENGEFVLKHRQVAEFSNIKASTKYCVTEVGVTSEVYDNVTLNGSEITIESTRTEDGLIKHDYVTGDLLAQDHVYVTFENQCKVSNLRNLVISKEMMTGQESQESFDIKLEFAEGDKWIPYVGDYYLGSSTGELKTTSNGIISLIPGQQAYVIGLISDTRYRVTEVLTEVQRANYGEPIYSGTGTVETMDEVTYIFDTIELNTSKAYMATITNTLLMVVNANKVWVDSETTHGPVYVGLYKQNGEAWTPNSKDSYRELKEGAWSTSFTGLNGGVYDVKELIAVSDESDGDFIINGVGYTAATDQYFNTGKAYAVTYEKKTAQNVTDVTITNTRLGKIEIEKVSANDADLKLQGAEFKLQKYDSANNVYVDHLTAVTDENGQVTFANLAQGTYKIIEIKAPIGYVLSNEEVIVELPKTVNGSVVYETEVVIENEILYELPSTGGSGIHLYTIGGTVLMAGAALILYKNKRREVL